MCAMCVLLFFVFSVAENKFAKGCDLAPAYGTRLNKLTTENIIIFITCTHVQHSTTQTWPISAMKICYAAQKPKNARAHPPLSPSFHPRITY